MEQITTAPSKRSPQESRPRLTIRPARNDDGKRIKELVTQKLGGLHDTFKEMSWRLIEPYWLVAEDEGKVIGCIQIIPSLPIAHMDFLCVDQSLRQRDKAICVKGLVMRSLSVAYAAGASITMSTIPFDMKQWKRVCKRRGAVAATQGNIMVKRLYVNE